MRLRIAETGRKFAGLCQIKKWNNEEKKPCVGSMAAGSPVDPTLEGNREVAGRENGMQEPAGTFGHEHRPRFGRLPFFQA